MLMLQYNQNHLLTCQVPIAFFVSQAQLVLIHDSTLDVALRTTEARAGLCYWEPLSMDVFLSKG